MCETIADIDNNTKANRIITRTGKFFTATKTDLCVHVSTKRNMLPNKAWVPIHFLCRCHVPICRHAQLLSCLSDIPDDGLRRVTGQHPLLLHSIKTRRCTNVGLLPCQRRRRWHDKYPTFWATSGVSWYMYISSQPHLHLVWC